MCTQRTCKRVQSAPPNPYAAVLTLRDRACDLPVAGRYGHRGSTQWSRGLGTPGQGGPSSGVTGSLQKETHARGERRGDTKAEAGAMLPPAKGRARRPANRKPGTGPKQTLSLSRNWPCGRPDLGLAACRPVRGPAAAACVVGAPPPRAAGSAAARAA